MPAKTAQHILKLAQKWQRRQLSWRRHLHQYPELSTQEHDTTRYLADRLRGIGLVIKPLDMATGVLAELHGDRQGPTVAIRSDIDALPIEERTGLPFASKRSGCMHACGHDAHMAVVLAAAAMLNDLRSEIAGRVRFIFQPAEELPPGGARPMIDNGALDDVEMILGLHVDPHLAAGRISLRDGPAMGSVFDFDLTVIGRGGHAARPHTAVDAITTAAEIVDGLQKIVSRETDPIKPVVISFGSIQGGVARNVVAESVTLTGTVRTLSPDSSRRVPQLLHRTIKGICRARGADYELTPVAQYPVLSNHRKVNRLLAQTFHTLYPRLKVSETDVVLGGEDFACYLELVPGAMFRLGVMNKAIGAVEPWHSNRFVLDEAALPVGSAVLAATTLNYLGCLA